MPSSTRIHHIQQYKRKLYDQHLHSDREQFPHKIIHIWKGLNYRKVLKEAPAYLL